MTRWLLHVDLDQFIAAVELLRRPELRGRPVVVGGDGDPAQRGVVATASYEARAFGVQSGLPLRTAARRCPDAVFLPVDRAAYERASARVMQVLRDTGAALEVMGWDEAFLAVDTGDPEAAAACVQRRVRAATQLNCSVGIEQNRLQAKLATGFGKPAGIFRLSQQNWFEVLGEQDTSALWGIGAKTAAKLAALGIRTVAQLAAADPAALAARFGPATGPWLIQTARGVSSAEVSAEPYLPRSRSRETTFQQDIGDWQQVRAEISKLAATVTQDVIAEGRPAVRVVVKVRYAPFFTRTHGVALAEPAADAARIEQAALRALAEFTSRRPVRLLGVRAEFPAEPDRPAQPGRPARNRPNLARRPGGTGPVTARAETGQVLAGSAWPRTEDLQMAEGARLAAAILYVRNLDRSADFYGSVLGLAVIDHSATAALLAGDGASPLVLRAMGENATMTLGSVGVAYVAWQMTSQAELDRAEAALRDHGVHVQTRSQHGVSLVEGQDPDGITLMLVYPGPDAVPLRELPSRIYAW